MAFDNETYVDIDPKSSNFGHIGQDLDTFNLLLQVRGEEKSREEKIEYTRIDCSLQFTVCTCVVCCTA